MRLSFLPALALLSSPAFADTVTVTTNGVSTADGRLRGQLCTDVEKFPGGACPYKVDLPAAMGAVDLVFNDVAAGTYAFQVMHDANSNGRLDLPHEGFAFGNDVAWPPKFDTASIKVAGDTKAKVTLTYFSQGAAAGPEVGVPPRDGVVKTDVRANGLYGAFYAPKDAKNLPVIIAIGGSEGGLNAISGIANSFASHGYAVLALAYWRAPGLPQTLQNVPLEYFSTAIDWVGARPEADAKNIGLMGWSRGGEGALLIASGEPRIHAVMAMSPGSHVVAGLNFENMNETKPAWTRKGQAVPFFTPEAAAFNPNGNMREMMDRSHAAIMSHPEAAIPVEKIKGPVLLLSGDADGIWNAQLNSQRVIARLKEKGFKPRAEHVDYPGAGHLVFAGDLATEYGFDATTRQIFGGTDAANAAARQAAWTKTLAFFDAALKARRP